MKQTIIFALGCALGAGQALVSDGCLKRGDTFGTASGDSWDDMTLLAGKTKDDFRIDHANFCTKTNPNAIGAFRFTVASLSDDRDQIRLSSNGPLNEGICASDNFEFKLFDQISVFTTDAHVSGIGFRKRDPSVTNTNDHETLSIGVRVENTDNTMQTSTVPAGLAVVGSSGTWDDVGLTSISFIVLDLACAGQEFDDTPIVTTNDDGTVVTEEATSGTTSSFVDASTTDGDDDDMDGEEDSMMLIYIIVGAGLPLLIVIGVIVMCVMKKKKDAVTFAAAQDNK